MAGNGAPGGFSLAFAAGKRPQRKVDVHEKQEGPAREAVVGFGEAGLQTEGPRLGSSGPRVIARQENTYK